MSNPVVYDAECRSPISFWYLLLRNLPILIHFDIFAQTICVNNYFPYLRKQLNSNIKILCNIEGGTVNSNITFIILSFKIWLRFITVLSESNFYINTKNSKNWYHMIQIEEHIIKYLYICVRFRINFHLWNETFAILSTIHANRKKAHDVSTIIILKTIINTKALFLIIDEASFFRT